MPALALGYLSALLSVSLRLRQFVVASRLASARRSQSGSSFSLGRLARVVSCGLLRSFSPPSEPLAPSRAPSSSSHRGQARLRRSIRSAHLAVGQVSVPPSVFLRLRQWVISSDSLHFGGSLWVWVCAAPAGSGCLMHVRNCSLRQWAPRRPCPRRAPHGLGVTRMAPSPRRFFGGPRGGPMGRSPPQPRGRLFSARDRHTSAAASSLKRL